MRNNSEYVPRNFTSVKVGKKIECTAIFTFDIETTSFFVKPSGEVIPYDKSYRFRHLGQISFVQKTHTNHY